MNTVLPEKLRVWIISSAVAVRSRIRDALNNTLAKPLLTNFPSVKRISKAPDADYAPALVIITRSEGMESILSLVSLFRAEESGARNSKIIVAIDGRGNLESSKVVELYLAGIDGFISEPFSISEIQLLISTLLGNEHQTFGATKTHHGALYVYNDAKHYIDQIAEQLYVGDGPTIAAKKALEQSGFTLKKLSEQDRQEVLRALSDAFNNVPAPKKRDRKPIVKQKKKEPLKVVHPAQEIQSVITRRKLSVEEAARAMRISPEDLTALLEEKLTITQELADALARGLGRSPRDWLTLQQRHDEYVTELEKNKRPNGSKSS